MTEPAQASSPLARILVVDDNADNRDVLQRRLERKGYEAHTAVDGETALAAVSAERFDAVLLDVMMPGMSGNEVLLKIRERYNKTELLVIMATAKSDSIDIVESLGHGANDYVTKPINFPVLLARLESHLSVKQEAAERAGPVIDVSLGIEHGTVLDDRYEILEIAGEGGFAQVYRARQLSTGQLVAFKHARPERVRKSTMTSELARFEREMVLIGQLRHPHIVRLIDSGTIPVRHAQLSRSRSDSGSLDDSETRREPAAGRTADAPSGASSGTRPKSSQPPSTGDNVLAVPYMVMEYLEGESLGQLMKRKKRFSCEETLALMLPVMSALAAAHEQGIVHRDVKPQNILLVKDHKDALQPKVLDFGIAKLTDQDADALTVNESFIGTPEFSAPEQARGKKDIDTRADQFSVAAILYQLLSGRPMYKADGFMAMVSAVVHGEFKPIGEVEKDLPKGVIDAMNRALSLDRKGRFKSIEGFARALLPFADDAVMRRWVDDFGHEPEEVSAGSVPTRTVPDVKTISVSNVDPDAPTLDEHAATLEVAAPAPLPEKRGRAPRTAAIGLLVAAVLVIVIALLAR